MPEQFRNRSGHFEMAKIDRTKTFQKAKRVARFDRQAISLSTNEIRQLGQAFCDLWEALEAISLTDLSTLYGVGQHCPGGLCPDEGAAFRTPREIVAECISLRDLSHERL